MGSGSYGNTLGCALPMRCGTTPAAAYAAVWFTMPDIADASRLTSTCCPSPDACRCCSAPRMPTVACRPVITSNTEMPDRYAGPPGSPVRLISPEAACTSRSYPGSDAPPAVPKPLIEA